MIDYYLKASLLINISFESINWDDVKSLSTKIIGFLSILCIRFFSLSTYITVMLLKLVSTLPGK